MGKLNWFLGLGTAVAVTEYGIAQYFFRRTMLRCNADKDRTQDMAGTDWNRYIPEIRKNKEWLMEQPMEEIYITSQDGLKLHGVYVPAAQSEKTVLCFHGYSSEGLNDYTSIARFYHELGYNLMIVDERAHGKSQGEYIGFGCLDRYDALDWLNYLQQRFGEGIEIIMHGISMGGATVLMASGLELPTCVKAIISDCAFTSAWDVFTSVLNHTYHLPAFPILQISDMMTKQKAGYGLSECNAAQEVQKTKIPILFIHGDSDTFVPCRMCWELYNSCKSPKAILIVKGAGHAEAYYKETADYEAKIKTFLNTGGTAL